MCLGVEWGNRLTRGAASPIIAPVSRVAHAAPGNLLLIGKVPTHTTVRMRLAHGEQPRMGQAAPPEREGFFHARYP